jgi:hypothetical protein
MIQVLAILQIIQALVPGLISLGTNAITAFQTNDQATLDTLHAQAIAAADALKPAGD